MIYYRSCFWPSYFNITNQCLLARYVFKRIFHLNIWVEWWRWRLEKSYFYVLGLKPYFLFTIVITIILWLRTKQNNCMAALSQACWMVSCLLWALESRGGSRSPSGPVPGPPCINSVTVSSVLIQIPRPLQRPSRVNRMRALICRHRKGSFLWVRELLKIEPTPNFLSISDWWHSLPQTGMGGDGLTWQCHHDGSPISDPLGNAVVAFLLGFVLLKTCLADTWRMWLWYLVWFP